MCPRSWTHFRTQSWTHSWTHARRETPSFQPLARAPPTRSLRRFLLRSPSRPPSPNQLERGVGTALLRMARRGVGGAQNSGWGRDLDQWSFPEFFKESMEGWGWVGIVLIDCLWFDETRYNKSNDDKSDDVTAATRQRRKGVLTARDRALGSLVGISPSRTSDLPRCCTSSVRTPEASPSTSPWTAGAAAGRAPRCGPGPQRAPRPSRS